MDSERIEELLGRYWKCETTLEEEQQLKAYFGREDVPQQWKETAALFRYFSREKETAVTDIAFDKSVVRKLNAPARGKIASLVFNTMRIAAGLVVLVLAVWLVRMEVRKSTPAEVTDTYSDPQMAFEETKKALMMISKSFNTAEEQAKKINLFNEAQEEIREEPVSSEL